MAKKGFKAEQIVLLSQNTYHSFSFSFFKKLPQFLGGGKSI